MGLASVLASTLCPLVLMQLPTDREQVSLQHTQSLHLVAPQLFDANLPGCLRLRRSAEGLVALAAHEQFLITDAKQGTANGLITSSGQRVQDVAAWAHGFVRLLLGSDGMITVEALAHGTWQELPGKSASPELRCAPTLAAADSYPLLAADGERIVVITDTTLYGYSADEWSSRPFTLDPDEPARPIHRVLLDRETLYLGTDMGEWGGDLFSLDLETRQVTKVSAAWKPGITNVADLDRGPDGRI